MALTFHVNRESSYVTVEYDYLHQKLLVRADNIPFTNVDPETNTFIIDREALNDEGFYSIRDDLNKIDHMPVPFGQFCFLIYEGDGEFLSWCNSDNYSTGIVCQGLKSFGYTARVDSEVAYTVDTKSIFTLKLKYGY